MQRFTQLRSLTLIGLTLIMLGAACLPAVVAAQPNFNFDVGLPGSPNDKNKAPIQDLVVNVIITAINIMLGLAAVLALAAMVWGGIVLITSAGNEKRVESAKKTITWAIIGLIVIGLSFFIVFFIGQKLGVVT
jgi:hypothetical protein